jgi:hypothetical protein
MKLANEVKLLLEGNEKADILKFGWIDKGKGRYTHPDYPGHLLTTMPLNHIWHYKDGEHIARVTPLNINNYLTKFHKKD